MGHFEEENTFDKVARRLHDYRNKNKIPLIVLAVEDGEVLGAAQLKYREMDIYPEKEHWLGGVYVSESHRGKKIAEKMIDKVVSVAMELGVRTLYLQTEHLGGGLYSCLGWQPIEQVNYHGSEVLVMKKEIGRVTIRWCLRNIEIAFPLNTPNSAATTSPLPAREVSSGQHNPLPDPW